MTRKSYKEGKIGFSQALPRSQEKMTDPQGSAYIKVSWLEGNFPAGLPIQHLIGDQTVAVTGTFRFLWQNLPFYSYGLAGDFHPTSFEIYKSKISRIQKSVKAKF
jgi:hypothetical protein